MFCFSGSKITYVRTLYPNRGSLNFCIDGDCQVIDNYSAIAYWQIPIVVSDSLVNTTHSVMITPVSSAVIDIDAIIIEVGKTSRYVATLDSGRAMAIDRTATFGDIAIAIILILCFSLAIVYVILSVVHDRANR